METPTIILHPSLKWKFLLPHFYHITKAPEKIPWDTLPLKILATAQGEEKESLVELITMIRFPLNACPDFFTWGSHNMSPFDFMTFYMKENPGVQDDQLMSIGLYRNVEYFNKAA